MPVQQLSEEDEDGVESVRTNSWELREQERVEEVVFAVKARGQQCTEEEARQALAQSVNKDDAVDTILQQSFSLPEPSRKCSAFEFVRNPPTDGGPSFQSFADGLSMARAVVCRDQDAIDAYLRPGEEQPTVEDAWDFLDESPLRHSESRLEWGVNVIKNRTPSEWAGRVHRLSHEMDSEKSNCLRALTEATGIVDEALNQKMMSYLPILQDILNKENVWYAGKTVYKSSYSYSASGHRASEHLKGCPEHFDSICQQVYELGTLRKVRGLLADQPTELEGWIALEFSCDMHVLKNQYEAVHADALNLTTLLQGKTETEEYLAQWREQAEQADSKMQSLQAQIQTRAQQYFEKQLDTIDSLQQALSESYARLDACPKSDREARLAVEREVAAIRERGDQMSMALQILVGLKDLQPYLDQGSGDMTEPICSRIVAALNRTDEKDAKAWNTHSEEVHCEDVFTQVFEELNDLMDKNYQPQYLCELHCSLQCWQTDSLPKHAFGLRTILAVANQKVHAKRSVQGPGVGQTFHCQGRSFEVVEVVQQLDNKRTWKDYSPSTYSSTVTGYWEEQLQFEIKYRWKDDLAESTDTIGFPLTCSHKIKDPCALAAPEFHVWLAESEVFEDLFGKNFHMQLLGSSGKDLIKYMSNHNLLTQKHADSMVGRIAKAHRSEKAEAHARLLDVLVSLDAAGQAHLLHVIAELLPNAEVIEMLLSKNELCQMLSSHVAAVALLDCLLGLMPHSESPEQLEQLQELFAEVIRTEEDTRKQAAEAKANEALAEDEDYVLDDDEQDLPAVTETEPLEPLRIQYVRQCQERIVHGDADAGAAYGLMKKILYMCYNMKIQSVIVTDELEQTYNMLNSNEVDFMGTIIGSFQELLAPGNSKEEALVQLQPRLTLLTALIRLCKYATPFRMQELETLLRIFVESTTVPEYFEAFLKWLASLVTLLDSQLLRHAFLLISEHAHFEQLGIQSFDAFKQLFVRINGLQNPSYSSMALDSMAVTTLSLDGMPALWKAALAGKEKTGESARQLLRSIYFDYTRASNGTHAQLLMAVFRCLSFCSLALRGTLNNEEPTGDKQAEDDITQQMESMQITYDERESFDPVQLIDAKFMPWSVEIADNALALIEECLHHTEHEQQCPSHRSSNFGTPLEIEVEAKRLVDVGNTGVGAKPHWESDSFRIVTHTNATMTGFKQHIAAELGMSQEKTNMYMKYGDRNCNEQSAAMLKGATLAQAGLSATGDGFKVFTTVLPHTKVHQQQAQSVAEAIMDMRAYFDTLFELCAASVAAGERRLSMRVWQLIQSLPSSSEELNALEVPEDVDWESLLGVTEEPTAKAFKAAYIAQIVSAFLQPADPQRTEWSRQWRRGFITHGGFLMMNSFFIDLVQHFANPMPPRVQYALAAVLQVMRFCITGALRTTEMAESGDSISTGAIAHSPFASASVAVVKQVDYTELLQGLLQVLRVSFTSHDESVAINSLHTIVPIMSTSEEYAEMILSEPQLLARLLVENQTQLVRKATQETLFKICERLPAKTCQVVGFVVEALQTAGPCSLTILEALDLLTLLLEHQEAGEQAPLLLEVLIVFVKTFPEENEDETILTKVLQLFADVISRWPNQMHREVPESVQAGAGADSDLAAFAISMLWTQCLYGDNHAQSATCSSMKAREAAGSALLEIVKQCPKYMTLLLEWLQIQHEMLPSVGTGGWDYWYLDPNTEAARRPAKGGYLGLRNQGLCCYQNSILQQLYLLPEVRVGVLSTSSDYSPLEKEIAAAKEEFDQAKSAASVSEEEVKKLQKAGEQKMERLGQVRLLSELQRTFAQLQFGVGTFFDPVKFVDACEGVIRLDHPVREQNDANDFFTKLCDQMDEALKGSVQAKLFERQLRIVTTSEWSITRDGKTLTRPGPEDVALAINIEVEGQSSLQESLALNFQPEDGFELKWTFEDGSEDSVESTKTPRIKQAPKTLVFNLKRYVFSLETLEYTRCADHFEFPRNIDIGPYMIEEGTCLYTLSGVVIHEGSSGGGHYYSYIRDRETNRWFKFDDSHVTAWDVENSLADDTFGGTKTSTWTNQFGEPKTWSMPKPGAYVLFYDLTSESTANDASDSHQASSPESLGSAGDSLEQLKSISTASMPASMSEAYDAVMEQNAQEMRISHVCNLAHIKLLHDLLRIANSTTPDAAVEASTLEGILGLALQFFFTTVIRIGYRKWTSVSNYGSTGPVVGQVVTGVKLDKEEEKKTPEEEAVEELMNQWRSCLNKGMSTYPSARQQLLELQNRELRRLLLDCPHDYARKVVGAMLFKACDAKGSAMLEMFLQLLSLMPDVKTSNAAQYGQLLALLTSNAEVREYARSHDIIAQMLHYLLGPKTPVHDLRVVAERGWGSRNYAINFNQEIFIKCLCSMVEPLEGLPQLSREALEYNNDVRVLLLSAGPLESIKTFVLAVSHSSEESTLQIVQWLARAPGEDTKKTLDVLMTLLLPNDGSPQQNIRVQTTLSALRNEVEIACHQGQTGIGGRGNPTIHTGASYTNYSNYSAHSTHNRIKKLVQVLVELSVIGAVKMWVESNKEFLVSLRKYMNELMQDSKVTTATGYTYTQAAKLQRTRSTVDAERALAKLIGEDEDIDSGPEFESRVDEIHNLLKQQDQRISYDDKREWCVMAARQEKDPQAAVDWILSNECSLETADNSSPPNSPQRKRNNVNFQPLNQQSSDEDYYGPI